MVKKKNKRMTNRKKQLAKLYTSVRSFLFFCSKFSPLILSYFMPALVFVIMLLYMPAFVPAFILALVSIFVPALILAFMLILMPTFMSTLISCSRSPIVLLFYYVRTFVFCLGSSSVLLFHYMPASIFCYRFFAALSSCHMPPLVVFATFSLLYHALVSCCRISALLLLLSMLSLPHFLRSSPFKTFKQFLSNEPWLWTLFSLAKYLCPFLTLGACNLDKNNSL